MPNQGIVIESVNFDMNKIDFIQINKNKIYKFESNEESITISINLNSSENNTLNSLQRKNHSEDQLSTSIENKLEYPLIIQSIIKTCENEYEVLFEDLGNRCLTCSQYYSGHNETNKKNYFQNGKCVKECDYDDGYCRLAENSFVCKKSDSRTIQSDNTYICGCLFGTVLLHKENDDNVCYLPEDSKILNELGTNSNLQCRSTSDIYNYCQNQVNNITHTKDCITYRFSGYDYPKCICEVGFTGIYCEFEEDNVNLNYSLVKIFNKSEDNEISDNIEAISYIRGINYIFENDKNDDNYKKISKTYIDNYIEYTKNKIDSLINNDKVTVEKTIYDILDLCIYLMKKNIQYASDNSNLRELADTTENDLKDLLDNVHYLHKKSNKDIKVDYNIQSSNLSQISFITYKKNKINSEDFKRSVNDTSRRKLSYLDIETSNNIYVTTINRELTDNEEGVIVYVSIEDNDNLNIEYPFLFYVSILDNFNYNLAKYYHIKGIDIYDENHKAFTEPCFISESFPFDLTQKYRKNNIFQKKSLSSPNCTYYDLDINANKVIFKCNGFESFSNCTGKICGKLTVRTNDTILKNANKVYNLPMRCAKKIKNVGSNYGFWTFLILIILEIIYSCAIQILNCGSLRKVSINKGCRNDDFCYGIIQNNANYPITITEKDLTTEETLPKTRGNEKPNNLAYNNFQLQYEKEKELERKKLKPFKLYTIDLCLKRNFKELHPVASLFRVSIITPLIMNSWFFLFNTTNLFGFNALIYLESIIEKRIYYKNRDNFAYPMRKEFGKIILSILLQIILAIIFRIIVLISLDERNNLCDEIKMCKDIVEASRRVSRFEKKMVLKRIITAVLMLVIYVFFFYYCVVFCGIYINTQRNWFFSGIWSLFWNWFVFSPIYIIIISFIEAKNRTTYTPSVYYMKRLFFF